MNNTVKYFNFFLEALKNCSWKLVVEKHTEFIYAYSYTFVPGSGLGSDSMGLDHTCLTTFTNFSIAAIFTATALVCVEADCVLVTGAAPLPDATSADGDSGGPPGDMASTTSSASAPNISLNAVAIICVIIHIQQIVLTTQRLLPQIRQAALLPATKALISLKRPIRLLNCS